MGTTSVLTLSVSGDPGTIFEGLVTAGWRALQPVSLIEEGGDHGDWEFRDDLQTDSLVELLRARYRQGDVVGAHLMTADSGCSALVVVDRRASTIQFTFDSGCHRKHATWDRFVDPSWALEQVSAALSSSSLVVCEVEFRFC